MVFRQSDMQIVLNILMGNDEPPAEDFVFDEMSMSAACEVMNQMMGARRPRCRSFLGKTINISTPTATILDSDNTFRKAISVNENQNIVAVAFTLDIMGVMNSEFISIMPIALAKMIISRR
jgi:flagellar motor switch protein FliN/FliY